MQDVLETSSPICLSFFTTNHEKKGRQSKLSRLKPTEKQLLDEKQQLLDKKHLAKAEKQVQEKNEEKCLVEMKNDLAVLDQVENKEGQVENIVDEDVLALARTENDNVEDEKKKHCLDQQHIESGSGKKSQHEQKHEQKQKQEHEQKQEKEKKEKKVLAEKEEKVLAEKEEKVLAGEKVSAGEEFLAGEEVLAEKEEKEEKGLAGLTTNVEKKSEKGDDVVLLSSQTEELKKIVFENDMTETPLDFNSIQEQLRELKQLREEFSRLNNNNNNFTKNNLAENILAKSEKLDDCSSMCNGIDNNFNRDQDEEEEEVEEEEKQQQQQQQPLITLANIANTPSRPRLEMEEKIMMNPNKKRVMMKSENVRKKIWIDNSSSQKLLHNRPPPALFDKLPFDVKLVNTNPLQTKLASSLLHFLNSNDRLPSIHRPFNNSAATAATPKSLLAEPPVLSANPPVLLFLTL